MIDSKYELYHVGEEDINHGLHHRPPEILVDRDGRRVRTLALRPRPWTVHGHTIAQLSIVGGEGDYHVEEVLKAMLREVQEGRFH